MTNGQQMPQRIWIASPMQFNSLISQGGPLMGTDAPYVPAAAYDELLSAATEILNSSVERDDPRISYVTMQVDRVALNALRKAVRGE